MIPKPRYALYPDSLSMYRILLSNSCLPPSADDGHTRQHRKASRLTTDRLGSEPLFRRDFAHGCHRRVDISTPQSFLSGANIVTGFEQMYGKRVSESMAARGLGDPCVPYGCLHSSVTHRPTHVMLPFNADPGID
jgi:hypothetical protein